MERLCLWVSLVQQKLLGYSTDTLLLQKKISITYCVCRCQSMPTKENVQEDRRLVSQAKVFSEEVWAFL